MNRIDHLGIAVRDLDAAERIYTDLLGAGPYKREEVADEGVLTSFFRVGESKIELLAATHDDSPIARHVASRGEGLHHVAFHVDDLASELARLEALGYRRISGPKPGADGMRIAFLHPSDTSKVLVEVVEG
jgi:methylmalonyl-CoA/ethylmalonyl-CoA epimerase